MIAHLDLMFPGEGYVGSNGIIGSMEEGGI